jgi:hypothetical protein
MKKFIVAIVLIVLSLLLVNITYHFLHHTRPQIEYYEDNAATVSLNTQDVTGTWEGTVGIVGDSDYVLTLILREDGNNISGTYLENHGNGGQVWGFVDAPYIRLVLTDKKGINAVWAARVFPNGSALSVEKADSTALGNLNRR